MPIIHDEEFGKITIRRSARSRQVSIKVAPDGTLRASIPIYAPLFLVKRLLKNSHDDLKQMLNKAKPSYKYENGMQIGKSHTLIIHETESNSFSVTKHLRQIIVKLPKNININEANIARKIRDVTIQALRLEAKSYLPRRLAFLAEKHGYDYERIRFSHSSGRWGSCSSNGTISLNIALMKLPFELIDYVILHELSHTKQMNHGDDFWSLVRQADPEYKLHRRALKLHNPSI